MLKLLRFSVPITRVDEQERIVEGYAFVNETVPGEGGMVLKRAAMMAATEDYLKWGAIRAMHQPIAAGTAIDVVWDDKGAFLRAKVIDDDSWKKVTERVYKAFSIGVRPDVVRGKSIEKCTWVENSLVDRPADPDAAILTFRMEDPDAEASRVDQWMDERGMFNDMTVENEKGCLRWRALDYLGWALEERVSGRDTDEAEAERLSKEAIDEFTEYWFSRRLHITGPLDVRVERAAEDPAIVSGLDAVKAQVVEGEETRLQLSTEVERLTAETAEIRERAEKAEQDVAEERTRAEGLKSDVERLEGERAKQDEVIKRLRDEPRYPRPVRFAGAAMERTVGTEGGGKSVQALRDELKAVVKRGAETTDSAEKAVCLKIVQEIKEALRSMGEVA